MAGLTAMLTGAEGSSSQASRAVVWGRASPELDALIENFNRTGFSVSTFYDDQTSWDERLDALREADLVWLHTNGRISRDDAMAIGAAHALGIPAYAPAEPTDDLLRKLVRVVDSVETAVALYFGEKPRKPVLASFQRYYANAAKARGYAQEDAGDCLILLVEEVGELARAVRKSRALTRHGRYSGQSEAALELADVFLYVVHMANILGIDLSSAVARKEIINWERTRTKSRRP